MKKTTEVKLADLTREELEESLISTKTMVALAASLLSQVMEEAGGTDLLAPAMKVLSVGGVYMGTTANLTERLATEKGDLDLFSDLTEFVEYMAVYTRLEIIPDEEGQVNEDQVSPADISPNRTLH